jgi:hypothetical protein
VLLGGRKSWTLEALAFDEYLAFDTSAFFWGTKRGSLTRAFLQHPHGKQMDFANGGPAKYMVRWVRHGGEELRGGVASGTDDGDVDWSKFEDDENDGDAKGEL